MSPVATTMRFAAGISDESDIDEALDDALGPIEDALGSGPVDLALVFASPHHADDFPRIAQRIRRQLDPNVSLAVTGAAVLGAGVELERRCGLSAIAGRLPGVRVHPFSHETLDWPNGEDDPDILRESVLGEEPGGEGGVLLFADPFSTPMVKMIPALSDALAGMPIVGGMGSAGHHPGDNRLLINDEIHREGLIGVGLSGSIRVDTTVSQGCRPLGEPWVITKARHNIIQELGGKNVLQVIRGMIDTLDPEDEQLARHGLLVGRVIDEYKDHFGRGDFLIRNIVGADEGTGYIAVGDLVRPGQTIQFHVRDARAAEEDLRLLMEQQMLHGPAAGAVLCTCNGRGSHMFAQPNFESSVIAEALGQAPLAGFFAGGEIGPVGPHSFLHGFTASLAVFRPAD